jgi:hypothetical protein
MKTVFGTLILLSFMSVFGNSIFSFDGFPIQYYGDDAYGGGMGETSSSDLFRVNTNYWNPSIAASNNKVVFSTAVSLGNMWYSDNQGNEFKDNGLILPYFTFSFPVYKHRIGFSFNSFASGDIENLSVNNDLDYTETNRISSSLYKLDAVYAFKNHFVNIGVSVNYYIGHRIRYWKLDFNDGTMTDSKFEMEHKFKDPGFSVGISKKIGNISLGASVSSEVELTGEKYFKYIQAPYVDTLDTENEILLEIPQRIAGGFTIKLLEKLKFSSDIVYEFWSNTQNSDFNTYKAGFGLAYEPQSGYGKWFERIPLRVGGYYRELPFKKNDKKITETAETFGFSIPLKSYGKKLDIAVKMLQRGDSSVNIVGERSLMFSIGITGFDFFAKRKKKIEHRDIPKADGTSNIK